MKRCCTDEESVDSSVKSTDVDGMFGVGAGGFCNFTNSIIIMYLQLWRPEAIQIDTFGALSSTITLEKQSALS